ncbi:MAG: PP2C family serine/threonine-protein phosphatase [bacterium]
MECDLNNKNNQHPQWHVISASIRGTNHEKRGLPCQDSNYWKVTSGNILISAIADGAGSASLSNIGAEIAVNSVVEYLSYKVSEPDLINDDTFIKSLLIDAIKSAKDAVESKALELGEASRNLATTLIALIATSDMVAIAQIGDGAVVIEDCNDKITTYTSPRNSEFINETIFLISPNAIETAQICIRRVSIKNIAMLSDGLQMLALKMPDGEAHPPFFLPLFRYVSKMIDKSEAQSEFEAFLRSPRIAEKTDDDVTLLIANIS